MTQGDRTSPGNGRLRQAGVTCFLRYPKRAPSQQLRYPGVPVLMQQPCQ